MQTVFKGCLDEPSNPDSLITNPPFELLTSNSVPLHPTKVH